MWVLFLMLSCVDPQTTKSYDSIQYQSGMRDVQFVDERGKTLLMTVWYPTIVTDDRSSDAYEPFTISLNAYKSTVPAVQQAPLVAFSHGFFAIRYQSAFLMEYLAEQGFVVVAVDHPFNTLYDFDDDATPSVLLERPDDLRAAVDELLRLSEDPEDSFYDMVDPSQYVAMGHSFGSHTAMVLGGGTLNYDGLISYCQTFPAERACNYLSGLEGVDLSLYGGPDERVSATIPMSPGLWYTFGESGEGLSTIRNPLLIAGVQDDVLEYDTEVIPTFDAMSSPKTLIKMSQVGHYGMTNICDIASFLSEECVGGDWQAVEDVQVATNYFVLQHLNRHYFGEASNLNSNENRSQEDWIEVIRSD